MLDAHQLNVFVIAAETLNFTQAARLLHMSQPSVSQHIQALEQHFEQELFRRNGRHIELTDAGRALLPLARDMVSRSDNIETMMKSLQGEVYGHLLVGCSTTPGKYILPHLLAHFHRRYPKVTMACEVSPQRDSLQKLAEGDIHFALASAPLRPINDVEFCDFMTDRIQLIAPVDHPWSHREYIDPEELLDADFILREQASGTQITVRKGLKGLGVSESRLDTLLILGNSEAIALAVQEGLGVGFVSSMVVSKLVLDGVRIINVRGLSLERSIKFARNTRRPPTKAQSVFWEFATRDALPLVNDLQTVNLTAAA
ncbi:MAG: LysR family transcriptional regulator [Anaerolineae bacterium]|nr:LysR family transcriptional regulator [Anaerolineae bacterium]MCO5197892.1 LysR family transcriptional regulator [Anaerolineae bacterium]